MKKQTNVPHWRTNQAQPQSITQYYTPSPRFDSMDADQLSAFIEHKIKWLQDKQKREAAYLDRRARRGTHTPTDEAYGKDQTEETELLAFLEHWKASLEKVEE